MKANEIVQKMVADGVIEIGLREAERLGLEVRNGKTILGTADQFEELRAAVYDKPSRKVNDGHTNA